MNAIELPTALVSSVREGKVILFLGSGAAKGAFHPTGASAPTGPELARRLAEKFLGSEYKDHPLAQVAELSISEHSSTAVQDFIAEQFRLFDPAPFHRKIAHLPWRAIATTNYDLIVERAYEGGNTVQDLVPFIRDGQRIDDRLTTRKSLQYLKLHGCITLTADPAIPLILTPEQYITHRRGRARLFDRLKELAYECPLFFIGHSLADSDIRAILLELDEQGDARPRSYVAVPSLKPVEERFWAQRRFTPIGATFEMVLDALCAQIPKAVFGLVPEVLGDHPLKKHFRTTDGVPNALQAFTDDRCQLVHANLKIESTDATAFYGGHVAGWGPIVNKLDITRSLLEHMLIDVILPDEAEREATQEFVMISGHAGGGKSVLLRRLAWEAAVEFDRLCLFLEHFAEADFERLLEIHRLTGKRIFLFIDRAASRRDIILAVVREARRARLPITVIGAERPHFLNTYGEALSEEITHTYELRYLNEDEVEALLERLETHRALGRLETLSQAERLRAFNEHAGRQLLVALHEATLGKPFADIVADEYRSIASPLAQALYRTIAVTHRLGIAMRAGIIARVHGISFTQFKERFLKPLERIVFIREDNATRDFVYETRHPVIAELVFENVLTNEQDRADEYVRVVSALDVDFEPDREAMRGMTRARSLQKLFPTKNLALGIVRSGRARAPAEARLLQQEAIIHMNWPGQDLSEAEALLRKASSLAENDPTIKHSLAELMLKRADTAHNALEKQQLRKQARIVCGELLNRSKRNSHPYHTLLKIEIEELRELADDASQAAVADKVKETERMLDRAKLAFPDDSHILEAEAQLADFLDRNEKVLEALQRAFAANARSPFIALRLARILEKRGRRDEAVTVLKSCLAANATDGSLHFRLAEILMSPHDTVSEEVVYHLRRSFTRGDASLVRQFWYARAAFVNGDTKEATAVFNELARADLPYQEKIKARAPLRDSTGRTLRFAGRVERLYAGYGFAQRDSDHATIFLHPEWCAPNAWQSLHQQSRITFALAFNCKGPVALEVDREP